MADNNSQTQPALLELRTLKKSFSDLTDETQAIRSLFDADMALLLSEIIGNAEDESESDESDIEGNSLTELEISLLRTLQESYDAIADGISTETGYGKSLLAQAITSKGVETSSSDPLPVMAEKVLSISLDTILINGGEMYAKQLFGSLETPNYWNLYEVLANLLSDGRLLNYGGILLAEYYKEYDSLALAGAGAGGAYVVSDMENGVFKMYTKDTTHTWGTEDDGKGNRWVAYCFADAGHDFDISNTNTSPRSIVIGRSVGNINLLAASRVSDVITFQGSTLAKYNSNGKASNWNPRVVLRQTGNATGVIYTGNRIASLYLEAGELNSGRMLTNGSNADSMLSTLIFKCNSITSQDRETAIFDYNVTFSALANIIICGVNSCTGVKGLSLSSWSGQVVQYIYAQSLKSISILESEEITLSVGFANDNCVPNLKTIYFGYSTNDRTKSFVLYAMQTPARSNNVDDLVLQDGWKKPMNVAVLGNLTEANIVNHILNRLGDNTGQSAITITLGATNLAKLTEEEKAIATNKGFTLA